jgi:Domain of unknown function (DUF4439)
MTSPTPSPTPVPGRPTDAADAAFFDAIADLHGVIYGYGVVSAHSTPDVNDLVSDAISGHRELREAAIAKLAAHNVVPPLPAVGYQLPINVGSPADAAKLALRMEEDTAVAWRAVLERATTDDDRTLAVTGLTDCAVTAARWRKVLGVSPDTVAFPGGTE